MSKKRFKKNRQPKPQNDFDRHHIFFIGAKYNYGDLKSLRNFHYCIIRIKRDTTHRQIHRGVSQVPVPKPINARSALNQLVILEKHGAISDNDSLERRLTILAALFDCIEQPTADALRAQIKASRNEF